MFKFLKSLFGGDPAVNKEAGVQIEQVPYKTEPPVVEDKVAAVNARPIEKPVAATKPAAITAAQKPAEKKPAARKPADRKPAAKKPATKRATAKKKTAK